MKKLSPVILRLGLAMVFVWFGTNQLLDQGMWTRLVPVSLVSMTGLTAVTIVKLNGIFELIMATLLAFGICIRVVAWLLVLHLISIIYQLGLSAVGIRDIGLMVGMLSVAFHGADAYSYDAHQ